MDEQVRQNLINGAARFVRSDHPERATIHDLYSGDWQAVPDPVSIGKEFCAMVKRGEIHGLRALPRKEWERQRGHVEYMRTERE